MIQKFVSIGTLVAACLLSPLRSYAAAHATAAAERPAEMTGESPSGTYSAPMEDKFRKLQKEMESGSANHSTASGVGTQSGADDKPQPMPESRSVGSLAFQILLGLIFVLLLAVVTIRVLKRLQGRMLSKPGKASGDFFEVLETCHLGTNQKVVALRMNDEVGILGVTPQGISLLSTLNESATEVRSTYARESNSAAFSDNLNKLLDRFKKPKRVSDLLDEAKG